MRLAIFAALSIFSSLLSSAVGFGGAPVSLAVGSLLLPVKDVVALSTIGFVASAGARTWLYRRQLDWRAGLWISGVSTQPGQIALQVTPRPAASSATTLVSPTSPCLADT